MFSKTFFVVAALVAGVLAAPSGWVFLHRNFFFWFRVNAYPIVLVNAAPRISSAVTKSRALTTPRLLGLLRASVSRLTLTSLSVSLATPSLLSALLVTNGKWWWSPILLCSDNISTVSRSLCAVTSMIRPSLLVLTAPLSLSSVKGWHEELMMVLVVWRWTLRIIFEYCYADINMIVFMPAMEFLWNLPLNS